MSRPTLTEFRRDLLVEFDLYGDTWRTSSELHRAVSNSGNDYYRVCVVLERLASDGVIERKVRGRIRSFRRASAQAPRVHQPPSFDDDNNPLLNEWERR